MAAAIERRQKPRVLVRVLVDFESPDTYLYDYSNNLSEGGIFIETEKPFSIGTPITLRFTLPNIDRVFEARGKVVWLNTAPPGTERPVSKMSQGMGVEFGSLDETDLNLIRKYIQEAIGTS
ncbi:MAG TPA: TIGR02266 family protein [Bdellovibrionota bacterium]|nr:TIGR02266 family protein [Bdellovibrionota bacterium]